MHMDKSSLAYQFFRLLIVSSGVYLAFRYLLPLAFPFLLAYILMRTLYPMMCFLHKKWKLPQFLSHYGTLFGFFTVVTSLFLFIGWKIITQLRLFFSNFPVYRQLLESTLYQQTTRLCHCIDYYLCLENGTVYAFLEQRMSDFEQTSAKNLTTNAGKALFNCLSGSFQFFAALIILIISMIMARYLGPSNFGLLNYANSIVTFVIPVMRLGMYGVLVQEFVASEEYEGEIECMLL